MKITLDHNCIIHLANKTAIASEIGIIVSSTSNDCFVVNIGASEMLEKGIRPDRYDKFEKLLQLAGIDHLSRLNPMGIYNVTFYNKCLYADENMKALADEIEDVLFGNAQPIDISEDGIETPSGRKWLNRICDVHSMWCHINNENDVFLTTDSNFMKKTKLPKLIDLGAKRICHPVDL